MILPAIVLPPREAPLVLNWPDAGSPVATMTFATPDAWRAFVTRLSLNPGVPAVTRLKYERAQKLFLLGWIDADLIKSAELVALTALELALRDRFAHTVPPVGAGKPAAAPRKAVAASPARRSFKALLRHLVDGEGLTDDQIPVIARCGGAAIGQLTGATSPDLAERRNAMAHGDPFDGLPTGGLVELVRDLIEFAYRGHLTSHTGGAAR